MAMLEPGAVLKIRNETDATYTIEELGGTTVEPGAELDLMDEALPIHYENWAAAWTLVHSTPGAKLCQDVQSGAIVVTESVGPLPLKLTGPGSP